MTKILNKLVAVPPLALAAVAVALGGGALFGSGDLPVVTTTTDAGLVAPAPEELSSAVVTRDWQEVGSSPSRPTVPPVNPPKDAPGQVKPPKLAKPPKGPK